MAYDAKKDVCTKEFPTITLAGDTYEVGVYSYAGGHRLNLHGERHD